MEEGADPGPLLQPEQIAHDKGAHVQHPTERSGVSAAATGTSVSRSPSRSPRQSPTGVKELGFWKQLWKGQISFESVQIGMSVVLTPMKCSRDNRVAAQVVGKNDFVVTVRFTGPRPDALPDQQEMTKKYWEGDQEEEGACPLACQIYDDGGQVHHRVLTKKTIFCELFWRPWMYDIRQIQVLPPESKVLSTSTRFRTTKGQEIVMDPAPQLPEITQKYLVWRKTLLWFSVFILLLQLTMQGLTAAYQEVEERFFYDPNRTKEELGDVTQQLKDSADNLFTNETMDRIHFVEEVFDYLAIAQTVIAILFSTAAFCCWTDFTNSYWWARRGWALSFIFPFVCVYIPWLEYIPPDMVAKESCEWFLQTCSDVFQTRYNDTIGSGDPNGTQWDPVATCDGPWSELEGRLNGTIALLVNETVRHECIHFADVMREQIMPVMVQTLPGLLNGIGDGSSSTITCKMSDCSLPENVTLPPETTTICYNFVMGAMRDQMNPMVHVANLFLQTVVWMPHGALLVFSILHILPTVFGFILGMGRGFKVLKYLVPGARLPVWLLVTVTACGAPMLGCIFVSVVCLLGTYLASVAAALFFFSMTVFAIKPGPMLRAVKIEDVRRSCHCGGYQCRSYASMAVQIIAVACIVVTVVTSDRFAQLRDMMNVNVKSIWSSSAIQVAAVSLRTVGFGFTTLVVFADYSINVANSVYIRPRKDEKEPRKVAATSLIELSILFPRHRQSHVHQTDERMTEADYWDYPECVRHSIKSTRPDSPGSTADSSTRSHPVGLMDQVVAQHIDELQSQLAQSQRSQQPTSDRPPRGVIPSLAHTAPSLAC